MTWNMTWRMRNVVIRSVGRAAEPFRSTVRPCQHLLPVTDRHGEQSNSNHEGAGFVMSERSSLSPYHRELMLSLAYLGGLTYALTLRLLPCYSARTLQRDLSDLRELGDVEKHAIYKPGPKGRPVKLYDVWTLTDKGHAYISEKANDQYPTKPAKLRHKRVMRHDLLAVETIVTMVELARKDGLSGLYVQCEMRLNPTERRPIPDAVVIVQFGGGFTQTDIVPWTKDPAIEDETRSRFVIEADNQTETLSVIAGKAVAYRAAYYDPAVARMVGCTIRTASAHLLGYRRQRRRS